MSDSRSLLLDLPFVRESDTGGLNMWSVDRTGDYAVDCTRGQLYADDLRNYIEETRTGAAFTQVIGAITRGGVFEAVEIGFCQRLAVSMGLALDIQAETACDA